MSLAVVPAAAATAQTPPTRAERASEITIPNVVATISLTQSIDLRQLTQQARNAEYNPKRFAAVIMRIRDPKSTALVFESGKMVVLGTKSEPLVSQCAGDACRIAVLSSRETRPPIRARQAKLAGRKYAKIIDQCQGQEGQSLNVKIKDFKVRPRRPSCLAQPLASGIPAYPCVVCCRAGEQYGRSGAMRLPHPA